MKSCAECEYGMKVVVKRKEDGEYEDAGYACWKNYRDHIAIKTNETDTCGDWKEKR